jgi:hypothetical protein
MLGDWHYKLTRLADIRVPIYALKHYFVTLLISSLPFLLRLQTHCTRRRASGNITSLSLPKSGKWDRNEFMKEKIFTIAMLLLNNPYQQNGYNMKRILLVVAIAGVLIACGNGSENSTDSDTTLNINSTTPPPRRDTNPIGIMMGDTSIGINDSLKK